MGKWIYPELGVDDLRLGKAVIKDVPVSIKDLYNVCKALRGMKVVKAKEFLRRVERAEEAIPYWRYARGAGHRSNIATRWGVKAGRFPRKAVKYVLKVLESAENNAVSKGLDPETLKLVHIAAHKGPTLKRYVPRAFGRSSPKFRGTAHIEVVVMGE